jgi:chorismate synthase
MASNSFGSFFKIITWGESHGKAVGVVIDGCPPGIDICEEEITEALAKRAPGRRKFTSSRKEKDEAEILSGVFQGKTTGTPISIIIPNTDIDSSSYEEILEMIRPGHANYTYLHKYKIFDNRGGGRASARETACRVAAGAVARKMLLPMNIIASAFIRQIGDIEAKEKSQSISDSPIFCPDKQASKEMMKLLEHIQSEGDSIGGVVEFIVTGVPTGIGSPIYEKLEAKLANAMLSIPASKGFEIGSGFQSSLMKGSEHNDLFIKGFQTNFSGGTLGGISTGMPIFGKVAFKPTPSIMKPQKTTTFSGEEALLSLPAHARHDPCVAIRAVPVVEAMCYLVLADAILHSKSVGL